MRMITTFLFAGTGYAYPAGRKFELYNIHDEEEKMVTNKNEIYFMNRKDARIQGDMSDWTLVDERIRAGDRKWCSDQSDGTKLRVCKFAVVGVKWSFINHPNDIVEVLNKKVGKCVGYEVGNSEKKMLDLVDCGSKREETKFRIKYLDTMEEKKEDDSPRGRVFLSNTVLDEGRSKAPASKTVNDKEFAPTERAMASDHHVESFQF